MRDQPRIETNRLVLAPLGDEHVAGLHRVYSDPQAMRFWPSPPHRSQSETAEMVAAFSDGPERAWALLDRNGGDVLGLVYFQGDARVGMVGLGYILAPDHWRKGLMSEALRAVLDHGFGTLGVDRVELWIDSENEASLALAKSLGFTRRAAFTQRFAHVAAPRENFVLGLSVDVWRPGTSWRHGPPVEAFSLVPVLPVADVLGSVAFYRDKLDFSIAFLYGDPPSYAGVWLGSWSFAGAHIHFAQSPATPTPPPGFALYVNVRDGIDDLCALYRSRGIAIVEEPDTKPWGQREFVAADCNGYLLRFGTAA
jgi:[ribosomal protein S5]-alanine N-acetyltransferase